METYEIHNREVLLKGLATCAGECCKDDCPYYGKTSNGTSCRARLLEDAMAALVKDKNDLDEMEAAARTFREERDKLNQALTAVIQHRDELAADKDMLREENKSLRKQRDNADAALDGMRIELERLTADNKRFRMLCQEKTDQQSARSDDLVEKCETYRAEANYWTGRAEGLLEVIKTLFGAEEASADE